MKVRELIKQLASSFDSAPRCDMAILYPPGSSKVDGVLNRNHDIARSVLVNATLVDKRYGRDEAVAWVKRFFVMHRLNDWKVQEWTNLRI